MRDANSESLLPVPIPAQSRTQAATENQHNTMQNYCKTIGALAAASALVAGNALAGTPAPVTAPAPAPECDAFPCLDYELHVGYTNEYLYRGNSLGLDLVEAGFDVATEWNKIGLSAGVWYANYDTKVAENPFTGDNINDAVNEIDLYAEASYDLGFAKASVGYIYYYNDQDDGNELFFGPLDDTQEVYFGLSRDFGFAEASLTYFWDISGDNDGYTELGLTRSFELMPCLALNVGTNVSYVIEPGEFGAWTTKVGLDWSFAEKAKLSPFVALAIPLSDEDNTYYQGSDNEFVAGSMLSVSF
jgi:predicted porin